jgi:hypothetical protein
MFYKFNRQESHYFVFLEQDMQHKIKEVFRGIPDEFMTSNLASQAKVGYSTLDQNKVHIYVFPISHFLFCNISCIE